MSLLLLLNLLSCLPLLSLILIIQVDSHQYLILLECLHLFKILVIQTASECKAVSIFFFIIQIEIPKELLLSSQFRHRIGGTSIVWLLRIYYCIELKRCHYLPNELIISDLSSNCFIFRPIKTKPWSSAYCRTFRVRLSVLVPHFVFPLIFLKSTLLYRSSIIHVLYNLELSWVVKNYILLRAALVEEQTQLILRDVICKLG